MALGASVKVGMSAHARDKIHLLVDLLALIFLFPWYKQVVAMSKHCSHLVFVAGLDGAFALSKVKMTTFLFHVLAFIKLF